MLTVTVPDDDLLARLDDLTDRVRLVRWDMTASLPAMVAQQVDVVVVPHYFTVPGGFARLRELPRLRAVQLPSAGFEHAVPNVPMGVTLCNGRGVHSAGTSELAVALILAMQRRLPDAVRAMDECRWQPVYGPSLADRTVLLLGAGSVSEAVAARLAPFEVRLVRVGTSARGTPAGPVHAVDELGDLLPDADVVVVTLPGGAATRHVVDAATLARMKDGALLVNVGRGSVVDTDALVAELATGRLRAALDVTDPEPLPADHPLWRTPNTLITPHVGGFTDATRPRIAALVRRQIEALLDGRPLENVVRA
jgi:phosphoglycerate dehydrogenase-like enzyme